MKRTIVASRCRFGLLLGTLTLMTGASVFAQQESPDFAAEVAPLFTKYCAGCHNSDDAEGEFSVESLDALQRGGASGAAIVAGRSSESLLFRLVAGLDEPLMPPEDNERPTKEEIEILRRWIDTGAEGMAGHSTRQLLTPTIVPSDDVVAPITALAVSPDGRTVAVARFQTVELLAADQKQLIRTLTGFPGKVNAVHFSADGKQLVTACGVTGLYGEAVLWDVETGNSVRTFSGHRDTLYDAELNPEGSVLATCSYDRHVRLWDVETGELMRTLAGHNDAVYDLAFSPDGTVFATASGDETIKIWKTATGERLDTLSQPEAEQFVVKFSPDGRYVVGGGGDNRIRVWRLVSTETPKINPLVYSRFAHESSVTGLAFTSDGRRLISAADDMTVKQWETRTYTQTFLYDRQPDLVSGVNVLGDDAGLLVGRMDGSLEEYELPVAESGPAELATEVVADAAEADGPMNRVAEHEPNGEASTAMRVFLPARIEGTIHGVGDAATDDDLFRFTAAAGEEWVFEVNAARQESPLDSRLEILDADGNPVARVMLQAVRDSYFTFRGKDSDVTDDFRVHNWEEMDLNQFLFANGEVVKLWQYPRGPDSGFLVYPGTPPRHTYFATTPMSHALHQPCYIVEPHPPGTRFIPNGLPVFTLFYENDDDSLREVGSDSRLLFQTPEDGEYLVRLSDARSFHGSEYKYELAIRRSRPDFVVSLDRKEPSVSPGSGQEFTVTAKRVDGFEGEIEVTIDNLPNGFHATSPLVIEAGQQSAKGVLFAAAEATVPSGEAAAAVRITARASVNGATIEHAVDTFDKIELGELPKLLIRVTATDSTESVPDVRLDAPLELTVSPGQTVMAKVIVERRGFDGRVGFGTADAGRNLPHGVYVDNIGLNGLMIVEGQQERTFFITAAKNVPDATRLFHLRADVDGNPTSWPVVLHVRRPTAVASTE